MINVRLTCAINPGFIRVNFLHDHPPSERQLVPVVTTSLQKRTKNGKEVLLIRYINKTAKTVNIDRTELVLVTIKVYKPTCLLFFILFFLLFFNLIFFLGVRPQCIWLIPDQPMAYCAPLNPCVSASSNTINGTTGNAVPCGSFGLTADLE